MHDLCFDLLACSPFNVLFLSMDIRSPLAIVTPLRLLRVLSVFKIPDLLNKIEVELIQMATLISFAKTIYFLIYIWHFSSCMWFFVNISVEDEDEYKWLNYNELENETLTV